MSAIANWLKGAWRLGHDRLTGKVVRFKRAPAHPRQSFAMFDGYKTRASQTSPTPSATATRPKLRRD